MTDVIDLEKVAQTPPMRVQWRVMVKDKVYGPYPRAKLLDFLQEGRVAAHTKIACGSDEEFYRADEHPNLRWDFPLSSDGDVDEASSTENQSRAEVSNFFVSGRLLTSHAEFERVLHQCGKFARAGSEMWVLRSRIPLPQLRNRLSIALKKDEQFVIVNASKGRLAWFNLGAEHDVAVRSVWNADIDLKRF